jgi:hypothetical protein
MGFYNDSRVRAGNRPKAFSRIDPGRMVGIFTWDNPDTEESEDLELPFKFEVCSICDGTGTHVNPSIDAHGLTREDFEEDPEFEEDYRSGRYDVPCYNCNGANVEPVLDESRCPPKWLAAYTAWERDLAESYAIERMEREMGA